MNIRPDYFRTEQDAGCEWMRLMERNRRANLCFHLLLAGIGAGMVLAGYIIDTLRMIP